MKNIFILHSLNGDTLNMWGMDIRTTFNDIDIYKVLFMLAVHELEEIYIGDLTIWDISKEEKMEIKYRLAEIKATIKNNVIKAKEDLIESKLESFDKTSITSLSNGLCL